MKEDPIRDRQARFVNQKELRNRLNIAYSKMYGSDPLAKEYARLSQSPSVRRSLSHWLRLSMRSLEGYRKPLVESEDKFSEYKNLEWVALEHVINSNTERILDSIYDFKESTKVQHAEIYEVEQSISQRMDLLISENDELRRLLDARYSSKALFVISLSVTIGLLATLLAWFGFGVLVIHPVLSSSMLIGSIGFNLLSYRRLKKHE